MARSRFVSWLPLAVLLALAMTGVIGLFLGIAGHRQGMRVLPDVGRTDSATAGATGSTVDVLHDPVANFTRGDVTSRPDFTWTPWDGKGYIRAFYGEAVWVRITLKNPQPLPIRGVLADAEYYTDHLDLWMRDAAWPEGWLHQRSGEWVPSTEKSLWGRDAAFFIDVPAHGERTAYLRLQDYYGVWLLPVWWPDARAFFSAQLRDTVAEACYVGALLALFVYNGIIWARLRHRDLGHYLGYLAAIGLFMCVSRSDHQMLGFSIGSPTMETLLSIALGGSGIFLIQFAREFLQLSRLAPRTDRLVRIMRTFLAVLLVALLVRWSNNTILLHLTIGAIAVTHTLLFAAAIVAWRNGSYHARYFVLSFGFLLAGLLPTATIWLLSIPLGLSALWLRLGSALEMLLLSLALSDRFARLQHSSLAAQLAEEKTRLELLRYQLNPHFLFNALNSIYGLVYPHSRTAGEQVRRLADFCRTTFTRDGNQWRRLGEELAMLRLYLDIEQARWRDRLVIAFAPDPAADSINLPAFLLLPLAENAIKHGGATSPDVLTLRITTRALGADAVEIEFANTGHWQEPDEPRTVPSHGIGLENLRARLTRCFPGTHQLDITSRDGWVHVVLRLPRLASTPV